jgi:hypothetical protein
MAKIQQKLKESLEKQSMTCIDRLAKTLGTQQSAENAVDTSPAGDIMELDNINANSNIKNAIDACDSMTPQIAIVQEQEEAETDPALLFKGENKAVIRGKKRRQSKHDLVSAQKKKQHQATTASSSTATSNSSRPKPRYFCKF